MSTPSILDLLPGTRVVVSTPGHLNGLTGVVVDHDGSKYDVAVRLDETRGGRDQLGFFCHELQVAS